MPTNFDIMEENDVELYLAASNEDLYGLAQNMVDQAPTRPEPTLNTHKELQVNVHDIGPALQPYLPRQDAVQAQAAVDETHTDESPAPSEGSDNRAGSCDTEAHNQPAATQKGGEDPPKRVTEVDLTQPEPGASLLPPKKGNECPQPDRRPEKSKQKVGPQTTAAFREALEKHLGFCVFDDYSKPLGAEKLSSKCCGARQENKFLLHLAECTEHTRIRSHGKSTQPFEINFSFEDLLHMTEQKWEPKVDSVADGNEGLKDLLTRLLGICQEAIPEVRRLFGRVATESCDPQVCLGTLTPLLIESLAWTVTIGVAAKDRFNFLVDIHGSWREHKRIGLDLLRSLEDGKGAKHLDCRQPDYTKYCRSNQLRNEVVVVHERCLHLWEGVHEEINGLGYLTPIQQSFLESTVAAWQTNLSRARYLVSCMKRRRVVVDPLRACWYLLEGPSDSGAIEPLMGKKKKGQWQYVQSGLYKNIAIASQLYGFNKTKGKVTKGEAEGQSGVPNVPCANRYSVLEEGEKERGATTPAPGRKTPNKTSGEPKKFNNQDGGHYKEKTKSSSSSQGFQSSHSNQGPHRSSTNAHRSRSGERNQRRENSPGQSSWPGHKGGGGGCGGGQQNPKRVRRFN